MTAPSLRRGGLVRHPEEVMGTIVSFAIRPGDLPDRELWLAVAEARASLQRDDAVFSTWKARSPLSRYRRGEITLAQAPQDLASVLELCEEARRVSEGWFDPWAMPGGVDPTGLVKGWAAGRALAILQAAGVRAAMVNAAGDLATFGQPADGRLWRVGVQHPTAPDGLAAVLLVDGAVATSGTYQRGPHLHDPFAGVAQARLLSATVTGPDLARADALATALAVAGPSGLGFVDAVPGYEAYAICFDGSTLGTAGLAVVREASSPGGGASVVW